MFPMSRQHHSGRACSAADCFLMTVQPADVSVGLMIAIPRVALVVGCQRHHV